MRSMLATVRLENWSDAHRLATWGARWVFRGHASARWELETALERACRDGRVATKHISNREFWMLRQFQRRAHIVVNHPPELTATLDWLALIQHYGGPTRLLDFSYSLYVAAFFAIEFATEDAAIWAINLQALDQANDEAIGSNETIDHMNRRYIETLQKCVSDGSPNAGVIYAEPDRLNERMAAQQGIFLFPKDAALPFMINLRAAMGESATNNRSSSLTVAELNKVLFTDTSPNVIKFVLPRDIHDNIMDDLVQMNIAAHTLFPGLDGFARSLHRHARFFRWGRQ